MEDSDVDLRLLECLQTLVFESHVTRAAERLGMGQPKMSSVLARLRRITGDPLLVRTPQGMMPTDLARELASCSDDFLKRWNGLVGSHSEFSPAECDRAFTIHTTDFIVQDLIVKAARRIHSIAPKVTISIAPPAFSALKESLETGETDLGIGYVPHPPQELYVSQLTSYEICCIASADHPRIRDQLDLFSYIGEAHVVLTFGRKHLLFFSEQYIESLLAERNLRRRIGFLVPSPLTVPDIVANSDMLALVPRPLAATAAARLPLRIFAPPLPLPEQHIGMLWHARTKNDPPNRWLRGILRDVAQESNKEMTG